MTRYVKLGFFLKNAGTLSYILYLILINNPCVKSPLITNIWLCYAKQPRGSENIYG